MNKYQQVWKSLEDEEYRREYSADVGTGLAFQIKLLREKNGWTQEALAERTGKQQETISQWEHPDYGSYTLSSLKTLAAAFDVALMVRFAPFSEVVEWNANLTPDRLAPPSFAEEQAANKRRVSVVTVANEPIFVTAAEPFAGGFWTLRASDVPQYSFTAVTLEEYARVLNAAGTPSIAAPSKGTTVQRREERAYARAA
jgi:transcriptional regulator with XRE-family HTH domain